MLAHWNSRSSKSTTATYSSTVIMIHRGYLRKEVQIIFLRFEVVQLVLKMLGQPMVQSIATHFDES